MKNKSKTRIHLKDIILQGSLFCLIYIALFLISSPWLTQALMDQKRTQYSIYNFTPEEIKKNILQAEASEEQSAIEAPDFGTVLSNITVIDRKDVVGAIAISDLKLLLPVLEGTTTSNLIVGATTIKAGQVMGKGNYCLAGHHMKNDELLFGPLLQIKVGSLIQLSDKKTIYTYQVTETRIVPETDLTVLKDQSVPLLTLITCDISGINTDNRFIVIGELVDESNESTGNEYVSRFKHQVNQIKKEEVAIKYCFNFWLIIIFVLSLVMQILLIRLSRTRLKKKKLS